MKNKIIGGGGEGVLSNQPDQQKRPQCKNAQIMQNYYQTLEVFSSLVSLTRHFTIFIFLEQPTAMHAKWLAEARGGRNVPLKNFSRFHYF